MMKIKKIAICCLTLGCLSLGTVGVTAFAVGNPYEDYKNALVNTVSQQNLTVSASVEMKQDNVTIANGNAVYQKASDSQYSSEQQLHSPLIQQVLYYPQIQARKIKISLTI